MKIKRLFSAVIAIAMVMSICCISVSATDLTSANYGAGLPGVKANTSYVSYSDGISGQLDVEQGSGGTTGRSSARATVPAGKTVNNEQTLINCRDNVSLDNSSNYVHSTFRFNSTASFYIYIRVNGSSKKWVLFEVQNESAGGDGKGGVYRTSSSGTSYSDIPAIKCRWDVTTDVEHPKDNTVHIILNTTTGAGYCFVNGKLGAYMPNTQKDGSWQGYEIRTAPDLDNTTHWTAGASFQWKYNEDSSVGYTWYKDTVGHIVAIEDIFAHHNVLNTNNDDPHFVFSNNDPWSYAGDANGATVTFPLGDYTDTMNIKHNYYHEGTGWAQYCLYFFGSDGYRSERVVGGDLLYLTYTQKINNATRAEVRYKAGSTVDGDHRFTFTPDPDNGKFHANGFSGTGKTLDKLWSDSVNVGILVDRSGHKIYSFVDGKQLGAAQNFSSLGDFVDLRIYLNGTEEDNVADITLSNWLLKQYDSSKDAKGLIAENAEMPVYFTESGNLVEFEGDQFAVAVTAQKTFGADDVSDAKVLVTVYDENGNLLCADSRDYSDGETIDDFIFDRTGDEAFIKTFCWSGMDELQPLALANEFVVSDYVE